MKLQSASVFSKDNEELPDDRQDRSWGSAVQVVVYAAVLSLAFSAPTVLAASREGELAPSSLPTSAHSIVSNYAYTRTSFHN